MRAVMKTKPHPIGIPCTVIVCPWNAKFIGGEVTPVSTELVQIGAARLGSRYTAAAGLSLQETDMHRDGKRCWYPVNWMVPIGIDPYANDDRDEVQKEVDRLLFDA